MDPSICWSAAAVATVVCCYLSLALGALYAYSLARFEELLEADGKRMERVKDFLDHEERVVVALTALRGLFLTGGVVALTGGIIAETVRRAPEGIVGSWGWALAGLEATGLGLLLFVALGHVVPRAIGERRAEPILLRLLTSLRVLDTLALPLGWLMGGLAVVTLRVFNVAEVDEKEEAKHEILSAALIGESEGVIDEATKDVIENLMEFGDVDVTEVMTPRIDIVSVDVKDELDAVVQVALEGEKSRLPVTDGSLDKIVGILMVKDLLRALREPGLKLTDVVRKPLYVPETKKVADLLVELRTKQVHMAIVADEYGGTAGLVTIEDLIEEIIGEIADEHDRPDLPVRKVSDNVLDVDAKYHIDALNEEFGTKVPEDEDVETLGGWIALRLGRIPAKGDRVVQNGTTFTVTEADERRVRRVQVKLR